MARAHRQSAQPLDALAALQERPHEFSFYSAVRLLECIHRDRPRLGDSQRPSDDAVRLTQDPSVTFAPATLAGYAPPKGGVPARLSSYAFGLFGPHGPLPLHLTEFARARQRNEGDQTLVRFFDLFHHRMLSLFYRAWADAQPAVQLRPAGGGPLCRLRRQALIGIGGAGAAPARRLSGRGEAALSPACWPPRPAIAEGLRAMIAGFFGLPVRIEELVGRLAGAAGPQDRWQLGPLARDRHPWPHDRPARRAGLGCCQHKLSHRARAAQLRRLPVAAARHGQSLKRLRALVRSYLGDELAWDVNLILKGDEVPPLTLGKTNRLGLDQLARRPRCRPRCARSVPRPQRRGFTAPAVGDQPRQHCRR